MNRWVSFAVLLVVMLVVGAMFYRILAGFVVPLFLAAILVVLFQPMHRWMIARCGPRVRLAALLTTACALLTVLVPSVFVLVLAISEGVAMLSHAGGVQDVPRRFREFRESMGLTLPYESLLRRMDATFARLDYVAEGRSPLDPNTLQEAEAQLRALRIEARPVEPEALLIRLDLILEQLARAGLAEAYDDRRLAVGEAAAGYQQFRTALLGGVFWRPIVEWANPTEAQQREIRTRLITAVRTYVLPLGGATAALLIKIVVGVVIMAVALYFFLVDGPKMLHTVMRLSPIEDRYERELLAEFSAISRAVVLATLLSAAVQAVLAGVGFWFAGIASVFLLTLLTALFALIPFVGASAVWLPAAVWLYFVEERTWAAILLALYGALIVSMADNLVKPLVLHGHSRLHPLLALLSVLGGVQALGPIGILVGPMVVVFLQALLNILQRELAQLDRKASGTAQ